MLAKSSFQLFSAVCRIGIQTMAAPQLRRFQGQLLNAGQVQRDYVLQRVARCRETRFGKDHGFADIQTLADFRKRVPILGYEGFEQYIDAVAGGDKTALLPSDEPLERFTITTGSTGKPKLNPVTGTWLKEYLRGWSLWGLKLFLDHPRWLGRKMLQMSGTWDMGRTTGGYPISMVSALLARHQNPLLKPFNAIPADINDIKDPEARYYAMLRLTMSQKIGWVMLMNPGSLIRIAQVGDTYAQQLIRDFHDGTLSTHLEIPDPIRSKLASRIRRRRPAVAQRLEQILSKCGQLLPRDYWDSPVISCWLGGTAGFQMRYIPEYFGPSPMRDLGLVSSEGRHTIPLEDGLPQGVPSVGAGFYEFIPIEEADSVHPIALEGHELQVDRDYEILITNAAGYFRFRIGDVVRCKGFIGQAPQLEFVQKATRVGDLEGEKVTEFQVLEGAHRAAAAQGIRLGHFTAVPRRLEQAHPRYDFLVEIDDVPQPQQATAFLRSLDQELAGLNFLWRARRKEGVLAPPHLWRLPAGAWKAFLEREMARRGTGDFQFKHPGMVLDAGWINQFTPIDIIQLPAG